MDSRQQLTVALLSESDTIITIGQAGSAARLETLSAE